MGVELTIVILCLIVLVLMEYVQDSSKKIDTSIYIEDLLIEGAPIETVELRFDSNDQLYTYCTWSGEELISLDNTECGIEMKANRYDYDPEHSYLVIWIDL